MADNSIQLLSKLSNSFLVVSEDVYIVTLKKALKCMYYLNIAQIDRTAQVTLMDAVENIVFRYCDELFPHIEPYQLQNLHALPNSCLATFIFLRAIEAEIVTKCGHYETQFRMIALNRSFFEIDSIASLLSRHSLRLEPGSLSLPKGDFLTIAMDLLQEVHSRHTRGQMTPFHPNFYAFAGLLPSANWSREHEYFKANSPISSPIAPSPYAEFHTPSPSYYPVARQISVFDPTTTFGQRIPREALVICSPNSPPSPNLDWNLTQEDVNILFKSPNDPNVPMEVDENAVRQLLAALFPEEPGTEAMTDPMVTTPSTSDSTLSDMEISKSSSLSDTDISISPIRSRSNLEESLRNRTSDSGLEISLLGDTNSSFSPHHSFDSNEKPLSVSTPARRDSLMSAMSTSSSLEYNFPSIRRAEKPRSVSGPERHASSSSPSTSQFPGRSFPNIDKLTTPRRASGPGMYGPRIQNWATPVLPERSSPTLGKSAASRWPSGSSSHHPKYRVSSLSAISSAMMNADEDIEILGERVEEETEPEPVVKYKENEEKAGA